MRSARKISKHTDIAYGRSRFELSCLVRLVVHAGDIEPESVGAVDEVPGTELLQVLPIVPDAGFLYVWAP